jgi:hypothetical protein
MAQSSGATQFQFDETLTPGENIRRFLEFMRNDDAELTQLLASNIDVLLPLPADSQARAAARIKFAARLLKELS